MVPRGSAWDGDIGTLGLGTQIDRALICRPLMLALVIGRAARGR